MSDAQATAEYRQFVSMVVSPAIAAWRSAVPRPTGMVIERAMALAIMERRYCRVVIDAAAERSPRSVTRFLQRRSYASEIAFLTAIAERRAISRFDIIELNRRVSLITDPEKRSESSSASCFPALAARFPYDPSALADIADVVRRRPDNDAHAVAIAAETFLATITKHPFIDANGRTARLLSLHVLGQYFRADSLELPLGVASSANIDTLSLAVHRRLRGDACDDFPMTFAKLLLVAFRYMEFHASEPAGSQSMAVRGLASEFFEP